MSVLGRQSIPARRPEPPFTRRRGAARRSGTGIPTDRFRTSCRRELFRTPHCMRALAVRCAAGRRRSAAAPRRRRARRRISRCTCPRCPAIGFATASSSLARRARRTGRVHYPFGCTRRPPYPSPPRPTRGASPRNDTSMLRRGAARDRQGRRLRRRAGGRHRCGLRYVVGRVPCVVVLVRRREREEASLGTRFVSRPLFAARDLGRREELGARVDGEIGLLLGVR